MFNVVIYSQEGRRNISRANICCSSIPFYFLIPTNKHIQPTINITPPIGVIGPIQFNPSALIAALNVRTYNDPLKNKVPMINKKPAHSINLFLNSLYKTPANANANT